MVDVDVADRAQARTFYMLYFQAETIIIVSSNSESGTEDVRSMKVYMTPLARAKGKTFFLVLPSLLLCAQSTLPSDKDSARHKIREQSFPTRPHLPGPRNVYGRSR